MCIQKAKSLIITAFGTFFFGVGRYGEYGEFFFGAGRYGEYGEFFPSGRAGTGSTGNFFLRDGPVRGVRGSPYRTVPSRGKPRTVVTLEINIKGTTSSSETSFTS